MFIIWRVREGIGEMEPMNIYALQQYAQDKGYNTGRFICVNDKGIFEMQWFDAYYGFVKLLQPEQNEDSFITIKQLIELFGDEQKYIATIGYENEDD